VKSLLTTILLALVAGSIIGCGSQVVPSSGPRPPTEPMNVTIYQKEPHRYEVLGRVEVPIGGEVRWDDRGEAVAGFDRLKSAAAAQGANGLLLVGDDPLMTRVLAGYKGTFYQVPVRTENPRAAIAKAIYVLDE
jgi:hypothetical protein